MSTQHPPLGAVVGRYLRWQRILAVHVPALRPCDEGMAFARTQPSLEACIEAMRTHNPYGHWWSTGSWLRWWAIWGSDWSRSSLVPDESADRSAAVAVHAWADRVQPIPGATR